MLHSIEWRLPALGSGAGDCQQNVCQGDSVATEHWLRLSKVLTRTEDYQQNVEQLTKWEF